MRLIKLDASGWGGIDEFYDALLHALEAPEWHGKSINALIDTMVYGGVNGIEPPYRIWIVGTAILPRLVKAEIDAVVGALMEAECGEGRIEFQIDS